MVVSDFSGQVLGKPIAWLWQPIARITNEELAKGTASTLVKMKLDG